MDPLDQVLLKDVLKAYEQMGRVEAFVKDEKLLEAVLLKLFAQQAPQPEIVIELHREAPWLDFSNRLSYKQAALPASSPITDVVEVRQPWKEPTPMPLVELKKPVPTRDDGARDIVIDN